MAKFENPDALLLVQRVSDQSQIVLRLELRRHGVEQYHKHLFLENDPQPLLEASFAHLRGLDLSTSAGRIKARRQLEDIGSGLSRQLLPKVIRDGLWATLGVR